MKKILLLIYVCVILIFTGCTENSDTTATDASIDETKLTEQSTTGDAEMSDEEYLINLGKRLKTRMTMQEVIDEIGEPDFSFDGGQSYIEYERGDCVLRIDFMLIDEKDNEATAFWIEVMNNKTGNRTIISKVEYEELGIPKNN